MDIQTRTQAGHTEEAVLGGGCFWCLEAVFQDIDGVIRVESGYCGGHVGNPGYRAVCSGDTGHAEVVRLVFDPSRVAYGDLLEVFFAIHDPTTRDRQGHDVGSQYRSVIVWQTEQQRDVARAVIAAQAAEFDDPIVTELVARAPFYGAEAEHQNYFVLNAQQPYCRAVVAPKVEKFRKLFARLRKPPA